MTTRQRSQLPLCAYVSLHNHLTASISYGFAKLEYYDVRSEMYVFCMNVLSHNNYTHMQRSRDMTRMKHIILYARAYILRQARHTYRYATRDIKLHTNILNQHQHMIHKQYDII